MKKVKDWEIDRVINILTMEENALDRTIEMDENGNTVTFVEMLPDPKNEASFTRLKAILLSLAENAREEEIIRYLSEGYTPQDIAEEMKCTKQNINNIIRKFRDKCLESKKVNQRQKRNQ